MAHDVSLVPDLTICDREPITRLDRIQSFGFLIGMYNDWTIFRASANLESHLHIPAAEAIGMALDDLFDSDALHQVRNRVTLLYSSGSARLYGVQLIEGHAAFDLHLFVCGDLLILEGEPSAPSDHIEAASLVRAMIDRLTKAQSIEELNRQAARQIRAIIGFDRVMIYRFDEEGIGEVIAEQFNGNGDSFLGLHFPASDIPQQARELYLLNPLRIIADINSETVELIPAAPSVLSPLDLSMASTRAVSPVHIEYLRNMGIAASLSISIIVDGRLWGLIVCHHSQPRIPSFPLRTVSELFGRMYSLTLESRLRRDCESDDKQAQSLADHIITAIVGNSALLNDAEWMWAMVREMVDCDGLAICRGGSIYRTAVTPNDKAIHSIYQFLELRSPTRIFDFDKLSAIIDGADAYADTSVGIMAIPISRVPRDYVLLFRKERHRGRRWGGNPTAPHITSSDGKRISPRRSFAAYELQVLGRALPFNDRDRKIGDTVRNALIEVILRFSENSDDERKLAEERQDRLIAELNHRVRNILALIRGLITATEDDAWDLVSYVRALGGRVQALARAHDQVTEQNWGPVDVGSLIRNECGAFIKNGEIRLLITGLPVYLKPDAVATMALVVHELATNSAKYGALSGNGTIAVCLDVRPDEGLHLTWRENGGPPVKTPTRRGFGSVIIERTIPFDFQGTVAVRYETDGFEADFFIPQMRLASDEETKAIGVVALINKEPEGWKRATLSKPLEGMSVLLLEDNMIVALDAEDILIGLGARRVTMVSTVAAAQEALHSDTFEFAMLDVQIGSETSFEFAEQLRTKQVAYIFASGYGPRLIDKRMSTSTVVLKPYQNQQVAIAVRKSFMAPSDLGPR